MTRSLSVSLCEAALIIAAFGCSSSEGSPASQPGTTTLQSNAWNWVPIDGARCRDGSGTGIGVNPNPASDKLVILLDEGGACFNPTTCGLNRAFFGQTDFNAFAVDTQTGGEAGLFDRSLAANPVKAWNWVFVPYCTGDVFAGNNPNGAIAGVGSQQFVGYVNVGLVLARVRSLFPEVTQVLLTGISAGGFGSLANYVQVARAFDPVPVTLLDDSGPPMAPPYVSTCLANQWIQLWNISQTVLADCGSDCPDSSQVLISFQKHVARTYPSRQMALMDSNADSVISQFFGFGANDCTGYTPLSAATFAAGITDLRTQMTPYTNFGSFVFTGTEHITLLDPAFSTRTAGSTALTDFIASLLGGQVANVGP